MKSISTIKFRADSDQKAQEVYKILRPEAKTDSRVQTNISQEGRDINISITSQDINAHRSTLNSYGQWIRLYEAIGGIQ